MNDLPVRDQESSASEIFENTRSTLLWKCQFNSLNTNIHTLHIMMWSDYSITATRN